MNTTFAETVPSFSRDGHWMFFNNDRPGSLGGSDVWAAWRAHTHDDFGWEDPINLTSINSAFFDAGPAYFENDAGTPLLYFTSGRPGGKGGNDIYVSEQSPDGSFGTPVLVPELNSPVNDARPSLARLYAMTAWSCSCSRVVPVPSACKTFGFPHGRRSQTLGPRLPTWAAQ